jgi:hypothetical protein
MALQLQDIITAARDRHPAFYRTRVTNAVLARYLTDYQNELIGKCVRRDKHFLKQTAVVVVSFGGATDPDVVGAGVGDGLPGEPTDDGGFQTVPQTTGALIEAITDPAEGASVIVAETDVAAADAVSIEFLGAAWTTDAYIGKTLEIVAGPGRTQRRTILSNDTNTAVISTGSDGQQFVTVPTVDNTARIVEPEFASSSDIGVVTALPALVERVGYLVKLDDTGTPFIDYTAPLVANVETGVPLPTAMAFIGGTVRYRDGDREDLTLVTFGRRFNPPCWPACYTQGQAIYFCGASADWADVASIDVDYVPIAPSFTALTDYFLLPDAARPALVSAAASFMAMRVEGLNDVSIDSTKHASRATSAEADYLNTISLTRRGRRIQMRPSEY